MKYEGVAVPLNSDIKSAGLKSILSELDGAVLLTSSNFDDVLAEADRVDFGLKTLVVKNPFKDIRF